MHVPLLRAIVQVRSAIRQARSSTHPPRTMPAEHVDRFTQGGQIPVLDWYVHEGDPRPLRWTTRSLGWHPRLVARRQRLYYGETDRFVHEALDTLDLRDRETVIVGSETPWYECICMGRGARVTTLEYRDIQCEIPGLRVAKPGALDGADARFTLALSISSVEHAGLGRYGDPVDPDGDLAAMAEIARLLGPDGRLVFAVPIGADAVVWNAHRIYGRRRLPKLFEGWRVVRAFGFEESMFDAPVGRWDQQPVWLLAPKHGD